MGGKHIFGGWQIGRVTVLSFRQQLDPLLCLRGAPPMQMCELARTLVKLCVLMSRRALRVPSLMFTVLAAPHASTLC